MTRTTAMQPIARSLDKVKLFCHFLGKKHVCHTAMLCFPILDALVITEPTHRKGEQSRKAIINIFGEVIKLH